MPRWNTVALVGVGLIGGSIGLALRKRRLATQVIGIGRRTSTLRAARAVSAVTATTTRLERGVRDADLVVVCTPVASIAQQVCQSAAVCRQAAAITDAGSTKAQIVAAVEEARRSGEPWPEGVAFVGSHPLAGSEKSGPQHAAADLFEGRVVVVTPTADSNPAACKEIAGFWRSLGARVVELSPEEHDQALAVTSHLPHLAAAAIAGTTPNGYAGLTAGGWLDTTRIAAGDPKLWREIFLSNRTNVLSALGELERHLAEFRRALAAEDAAALERLLAEAKQVRDAVAS
jgi:prephenate dehydrogenase